MVWNWVFWIFRTFYELFPSDNSSQSSWFQVPFTLLKMSENPKEFLFMEAIAFNIYDTRN